MNDFLKCECPHCGQSIEYPAEGTGQTVPCPTCEKPVALTPVNPPTPFNSIVIPPPPATVAPTPAQKPEEKKSVRTILSKLTEETIRATTQTRDTPLHRAAKTGRISEIPKHLLKTELFMARNNSFSRETPLHLAAQYGHLDKIPREFLTKETLTASTEYEKKESKTGLTPPRTETPLHTAIRYGHADQIPKEFLTPEFLSIEASGYRLTVLHQLAYANRLDLVPDIYANSEMWNLRNSSGQTPRDVVETNIKQEAYIARVRNEPATEKQKEKLRYFGYVFDEKISKGQASDALDKCAKDFPEVNQAYYNRPATEEQLAYILPILEADGEALEDYADEGKSLTYQQAKDLIWDYKMRDRKEERLKELTYWESDDGRIDQAWARIDAFREVAREQVAKAWAVVKSRMTDKSQQPDLTEVEHTMEELFPELRKNPDYKALEANYIYTKQLLQQKLPTEDNLKMLAAVEGGLKKIKQKLQQS
ncbi:MAG: ankyrin repeat domain-containing protein, partial [Verrucomicrobiota bacterium]